MRTALITGAAGFIGFHLAQRLLQAGWKVVGLDSLNDYYDPSLKQRRLEQLETLKADFTFYHQNLEDSTALNQLFSQYDFERVIHLAAQAGVRYSIQNPQAYIQSNLVGTANILEACRHDQTPHLLYASSSSVYGLNTKVPFSETDRTDAPISLYAATKMANEQMAFTYSHLYGIPTTGLRFFTVYGPWGRPDMAYWTFTEKILKGEPIPVFNHGKLKRDFTYIDDIVEGIYGLIDHIPTPQPGLESKATAPWAIYNLGNHQPVELMGFIQAIEDALGKKAIIDYQPMQPGDVEQTYADIEKIKGETGWYPKVKIDSGVSNFVNWYKKNIVSFLA